MLGIEKYIKEKDNDSRLRFKSNTADIQCTNSSAKYQKIFSAQIDPPGNKILKNWSYILVLK